MLKYRLGIENQNIIKNTVRLLLNVKMNKVNYISSYLNSASETISNLIL